MFKGSVFAAPPSEIVAAAVEAASKSEFFIGYTKCINKSFRITLALQTITSCPVDRPIYSFTLIKYSMIQNYFSEVCCLMPQPFATSWVHTGETLYDRSKEQSHPCDTSNVRD